MFFFWSVKIQIFTVVSSSEGQTKVCLCPNFICNSDVIVEIEIKNGNSYWETKIVKKYEANS